MYKHLHIIVALLCLFSSNSFAGRLIQAGPMQGYTEFRTAKIWVEVSPVVNKLSLSYTSHDGVLKTIDYSGKLGNEFNPIVFDINDLEPGTKYHYSIKATDGHSTELIKSSFTTQKLWMYSENPPDFHFLTGSCSYFNDPKYDRPGEPFGGDSSIFIPMSKMDADLMLWLGDNWYTRDVDCYSRWGLWNRAHTSRKMSVLQPLLKAMPHYAIWDDHDYGPNNYGASYIFKDETRKVFQSYWANPSYGMDGKGTYTQFTYNDVAFFLLDDRTWRSPDGLKDSINGAPNTRKKMLGKKQLEWLKDALIQSKHSTFKIIANGSQILNTYSPADCIYHFPTEYQELLDFITDNKIEGVVFLSGDRHMSEIVKQERKGHYTLYDITVSPFTSQPDKISQREKEMPTLVKMIEGKHNFSDISITGPKRQRKLTVTFYDTKGELLDSWSVSEQQLKEH